MTKMTKAPATAKDSTSIPIKVSILVPKNKKLIIIKPATIVAFSDSIYPTRLRMLTNIGMLPRISITAKRTAKQAPISLMEILEKNSAICKNFYKGTIVGLKFKELLHQDFGLII